MVLSSFIATTAILIVSFYFYVMKKLSYWKERDVIHAPGQFLVGHMGDASRMHMSKKIYEMYQNFKGRDIFFGMYYYIEPVIVATDLDFIKAICEEDYNYFIDRGVYVSEKSDPLSAHLFALKGEKWRCMRSKLNAAFSSENIKLMFPTIVEVSEVLRETIRKNQEKKEMVDIQNLCQRFTADVIGSVALGYDFKTLDNENSDIMNIIKKMFRLKGSLFVKHFIINKFQKLSKLLKIRYFPKKTAKYFMTIIKNSVEHRESNRIEKPDFLNSLINLKNSGSAEDNKPCSIFDQITINELTAQSFSILYSGIEPTSSTLAFCFLELAVNQDIQEKLRDEIGKVLHFHNGKITYESITQMEYLDRVCNGNYSFKICE